MTSSGMDSGVAIAVLSSNASMQNVAFILMLLGLDNHSGLPKRKGVYIKHGGTTMVGGDLRSFILISNFRGPKFLGFSGVAA
jgi:hypothetical protein